MAPKGPNVPARTIGTLPPIAYASVNDSGNLTAVMLNGTSMTLFIQKSPRPEVADYAVYIAIGDANPTALMIDSREKAIKWRDEAIAEIYGHMSATSKIRHTPPSMAAERGGHQYSGVAMLHTPVAQKADSGHFISDLEDIVDDIIVSTRHDRLKTPSGEASTQPTMFRSLYGTTKGRVTLGVVTLLLVLATGYLGAGAKRSLVAESAPATPTTGGSIEGSSGSVGQPAQVAGMPTASVSRASPSDRWGIPTIPASDTWSATGNMVQLPLPSNIMSPDQLKLLGFKE